MGVAKKPEIRGAAYSFVTVWRVAAPIERVWNAIFDATAYPQWWKAVLSVTELEHGQEDGLGRMSNFLWKAPLGYKLRFNLRTDSVVKPNQLGGIATGELEGTGVWTLTQKDNWTEVRYDWNVRTHRAWMNWLAPIARPIFKQSHDAVMRMGAIGLADLLGVRVQQLSRTQSHAQKLTPTVQESLTPINKE